MSTRTCPAGLHRSAPASPPRRPAGGLRRRLPLAVLALAATAGLAAVTAPALAERPGEQPGQVGRNWSTPVQDAQPSGKAPSSQQREAQIPAEVRSRPAEGVQPDVPAGSLPLPAETRKP